MKGTGWLAVVGWVLVVGCGGSGVPAGGNGSTGGAAGFFLFPPVATWPGQLQQTDGTVSPLSLMFPNTGGAAAPGSVANVSGTLNFPGSGGPTYVLSGTLTDLGAINFTGTFQGHPNLSVFGSALTLGGNGATGGVEKESGNATLSQG